MLLNVQVRSGQQSVWVTKWCACPGTAVALRHCTVLAI